MSPSTEVRENREFASEIKFLVSTALADQIRDWARSRLAPDPNAGDAVDAYRVTSLYFDTDQFDMFHRKGSFGRSKYRVRRYGQSEFAFLERKLKSRGLLSKRRSTVRLDELERLANADPERFWSGYWFHRRLLARGLEARCQISYHRTARVAMTQNGPIRLTLDANLCALPATGLWFSEQDGASILEHQSILELKFRCEMPTLFKYLVEEFALNTQPFSKYRLAAAALGVVAGTSNANGSRSLAPHYA